MTLAERSDAVTRSREVVLGYHRDIDAGHATAAIDAFTDDAEFQAHGRLLRGSTEILGFLTAREANTDRKTLHVFANETVTEQGSDAIELRALVVIHVQQPAGHYMVENAVDLVHHLVKTDGEWKISHRHSSRLHPAPEGKK